MAKRNNLSDTNEFRIKRRKQKKMKIWQKILLGLGSTVLTLIIIVVVILAGAVLYLQNAKPDVDTDETVNELLLPNIPADNVSLFPGDGVTSSSSGMHSSYERKEKTYTFLVLGSDRAQWLTDVMMIATYDVANGSLAIMQIPRDTYVMVNSNLILDEHGNITYENFDGKGDYSCKINSVVWHGGSLASTELKRITKIARDADDNDIKTLCNESFLNISFETLKEYLSATGDKRTQMEYNIKLDFGIKYLTALLARSFGTPVDFYAHLNLDGFVNIVNAIGGVDVYIQEDMHYEDILQDPPLKIHLNKGMQHLDGKKAEQFIRFRYGYAAADIARIDAQKIFMTAFLKKLLSFEGVANIDKLISEVSKNLTTNIEFDDAGFFATNALGLDFNKIVMLTMPGWSLYIDGGSYYSVDKDMLIQYVNEYLNKYTTPLTEEFFCATEAGPGTNYTTPPLTAEDIENDQPDLGFMY